VIALYAMVEAGCGAALRNESTFGGRNRKDARPSQNVFTVNFRAGGAGRHAKNGPFYVYVLQSRG
jgi:hypothetical protein